MTEPQYYRIVTRHQDGSTSNMNGMTEQDVLAVVGGLDNLDLIDMTITPSEW